MPDGAVDAAVDGQDNALIDRGLAARYYTDESDSQIQGSLVDSSPSGVDAAATSEVGVLTTLQRRPTSRRSLLDGG